MSDLLGGPLDVDTIVTVLLQKQMSQLIRLQKQEKEQEVKLSMYGQLNNFINNISSSMKTINEAFNTVAFSTSVSNSSVISAAVTSNNSVYNGTHQVNVSSIAQAETLGAVTQFSTRNQALNITDTLTFTIGSKSFSVDVNAASTLENVRDAINQAATNIGVTASIITSTDTNGNQQYGLVIASQNTGTVNAVSITESAQSTFNFSNVIAQAQDAVFTFDGSNIVRSQNTVNDVLDGLTFTLMAAGQSTISVTQNNTAESAAVTTAINGFIDAYNKAMDFIDLTIANSDGGNDVLAMIKINLQDMLQTQITGVAGIASLSDLGIGLGLPVTCTSTKLDKNKVPLTYVNGDEIMLHADKLKGLLSNSNSALQQFFSTAATGFSSIATAALTNITQSGGIIYTNKEWSFQAKSRISNNIKNEENHLEDVKKQLTAKYAALNSVLKNYENIGNMLESSFSHMDFGRK